ncbi:MAG: TonB-dependent receptor [Acidobacteriota bacterium]
MNHQLFVPHSAARKASRVSPSGLTCAGRGVVQRPSSRLLECFIVSLALAFSFLPGPVLAGESKVRGDQESAGVLDLGPEVPRYKVSVTATREETPLPETGRSVTVITSREIEAMGATNVAEVLAAIPGVHVLPAASYGSPTSLFVRGGESDFTLVLLDGIPINRPGGEFDFAHLSTANIERIEVVRGPGSVLYGSEAAAATVHIVTRRSTSTERPVGNLSVTAGEYGTYEYAGHLEGGSPRVQYSLGVNSAVTDGIFAFNSRYRRTDLSAGTRIQAAKSTFLTATARYNAGKQGVPTDDTGRPVDPNDWRQTRDSAFQVALEQLWSPAVRSLFRYGRHIYHGWNYTRSDNVTDFFDSEFEAAEHRDVLEWENHLAVGTSQLLTAGLTWKKEVSEDSGWDRRSTGFFVLDRWKLGDRVHLAGGLRYEDNDRYETFTSFQVDAVVKLSEAWRIRSAAGNGFRSPSFIEIAGIPAFGILGNSRLQPERNTSWEAGVEWNAEDGRLAASGTYFRNHYRDLIEFTFAVAPGEPNFLNVEAANSDGIELTWELRPRTGWRLFGDYTWTRTEVTAAGTTPGGNFELGRPLLRRPRHLGGLGFEWTGRRLDMRWECRYIGSRDDRLFFPDFTSRRVRLGGYVLVQAHLRLILNRFSSGERYVAFVAKAENLLDRTYTAVAGFPSPGRRLRAGLEFGY